MDDDFSDGSMDPLALNGDGDHIDEMIFLFDDEGTKPGQPQQQGGCLGVLILCALPGLYLLARVCC